IAAEGEELEPLLGRPVKSWRELVDAIDWSWALERVGELAGELKPWIGPEEMDNTEREGLVRRMLGELALLTHFAEARRGVDDGRWREERAKRLAKAVEAMSGGRIAGGCAKRLAELIISYAERREERARERIDKLAGVLAGVSKEEVWGIVQFVLSDMYCLARDCARDEVMRKFVAPVLELIMLDKALRAGFDRGEALLYFGEMCATAVAGDGTVGPDDVMLAVGGELGGGAALLRLAALLLLNKLLPNELKFNVRIYVKNGRYYDIAAYGENAARLKRLLAVSAPSAGGESLSEKFDKFVEVARMEVRFGNIRLTKSGVAADLTLSEAGIDVKYNVYLSDKIELEFQSTDRSRVELAARLLKLAGVGVVVRKVEVGGRGVWYVKAYTDMLAAGHEGLRKALAKIVETARGNGWVEAGKAEGWLKKLESGRVLKDGWPKYEMGLSGSGALVVRFGSTNPDSIQQVARRLNEIGLVEGVHFSMKMPEGGGIGYVRILREGLAYAAWLSVYGSGKQQELAVDFVKYILRRAEEAGKEVYEKATKIVEEGMSRGSLTLKGFAKRVEVGGGKEYVVKVIDGSAEFDEGRGGRKLLRIKITAEVGRVEGEHTIVDRVVREYTITFGRYRKLNAAVGFAMARADVPGGRETDAERLAAVVEALTGKKPSIRRKKNGQIMIECYEGHLEGFRRYAELADAIEKWLKGTNHSSTL
ncbi:MAG: PaRep2b protein, partial [Pyrobaculum sp.]